MATSKELLKILLLLATVEEKDKTELLNQMRCLQDSGDTLSRPASSLATNSG